MKLKETIQMMESPDYKERFKAEYFQLEIRYLKLHAMLEKHAQGKLGFTPTCPISILYEQKLLMDRYLNILEQRAKIEGIEL